MPPWVNFPPVKAGSSGGIGTFSSLYVSNPITVLPVWLVPHKNCAPISDIDNQINRAPSIFSGKPNCYWLQ